MSKRKSCPGCGTLFLTPQESTVVSILTLIHGSYLPNSGVYQNAKRALLSLNRSDLQAIYAMCLTSRPLVVKNKVRGLQRVELYAEIEAKIQDAIKSDGVVICNNKEEKSLGEFFKERLYHDANVRFVVRS